MGGKLALLGGRPAVSAGRDRLDELFRWPIYAQEEEDAVLGVLREGGMSGTGVTKAFEKEYAAWQGSAYALGFCNGTAALQAAMFACGLGVGDEMICPSVTYWASAAQVYSLGATVAFADIDPATLCISPASIEKRISPRTKAIMVVHYLAHPADMEPIMAIAKKHGLKVIEDVSHAQGGLYKGRRLGTFGDVSAASLMSSKSLPCGEGGVLTTDGLECFERAIAFAHYERFDADIRTESLRPYIELPMGGVKGRMHQMSSAVARVQLKYYDARCAEIRKAMNYFWDLLEGVPGIQPHRVDEATGSNMAGWYAARGIYRAEELGGLSVTRFCQAVAAEGAPCGPGCNSALHTHPLFTTADIYGHGKPTRIANAARDVRELDGDLAESVRAGSRTYSIPWLKQFRPDLIEQHAEAFRKVSANYGELLADDPGDPKTIGHWHFYNSRA
ncbi:MAG: DegT/DnrJ/EryC1/StrS family aminotransferase [Clostridiales bacterium]|nr:DegT/DnrJ/EryC1/StrS family aminotransferase [Clostridiales bacterium]